MLKKDPLATKLADFACDRSYICFDGREVLCKRLRCRCNHLDWLRRKRELWERCDGKCEEYNEFGRCQKIAQHPHHDVKCSKQRDDRLGNLIALCREHHVERHPEKQPKWIHKRVVQWSEK